VIVLLVLLTLAAVAAVAFPLFRPVELEEAQARATLEQERSRLLAGLDELAHDRRAGMISDDDYAAGVRAIRRRLAVL